MRYLFLCLVAFFVFSTVCKAQDGSQHNRPKTVITDPGVVLPHIVVDEHSKLLAFEPALVGQGTFWWKLRTTTYVLAKRLLNDYRKKIRVHDNPTVPEKSNSKTDTTNQSSPKSWTQAI